MTQFRMITGTKYRHDATGVLVVRDEDKRTWGVRMESGETALYTSNGNPRRFRKFENAMAHGIVIVDRMESLA